jgi:hypothetical protein
MNNDELSSAILSMLDAAGPCLLYKLESDAEATGVGRQRIMIRTSDLLTETASKRAVICEVWGKWGQWVAVR